jgi:capsule polysaccharide export protein KpsE/RkpR
MSRNTYQALGDGAPSAPLLDDAAAGPPAEAAPAAVRALEARIEALERRLLTETQQRAAGGDAEPPRLVT